MYFNFCCKFFCLKSSILAKKRLSDWTLSVPHRKSCSQVLLSLLLTPSDEKTPIRFVIPGWSRASDGEELSWSCQQSFWPTACLEPCSDRSCLQGAEAPFKAALRSTPPPPQPMTTLRPHRHRCLLSSTRTSLWPFQTLPTRLSPPETISLLCLQ